MELVLTDKGKSYDKRLRKTLFTVYKTRQEFTRDFDISMVLTEVDENMLAFPKDPEGWDRDEATSEQLVYGEKDTEEFSSWSDLEGAISPKTRQILRGLFEAGYIEVIQ